MPDPLDPSKDLHRKIFVRGQEAVAQEFVHGGAKERLEQTQEILRMASDTIDLANAMAKDGDPHKQRIADLIKDRVAGVAEDVASGAVTTAEGRGAQGASPLSVSSGHLGTSLPGPTPKALPHQPLESPKRKRGRPRKSS